MFLKNIKFINHWIAHTPYQSWSCSLFKFSLEQFCNCYLRIMSTLPGTSQITFDMSSILKTSSQKEVPGKIWSFINKVYCLSRVKEESYFSTFYKAYWKWKAFLNLLNRYCDTSLSLGHPNVFNPFRAKGCLLWFSNVFSGYRKEKLAPNGLTGNDMYLSKFELYY